MSLDHAEEPNTVGLRAAISLLSALNRHGEVGRRHEVMSHILPRQLHGGQESDPR